MTLDWGWFCHLPKDVFWLSSFIRVTIGKRSGMLLNVLQGTERPSTTKNCSVQNISRVRLRNPGLKKWQYLFSSGICNLVRENAICSGEWLTAVLPRVRLEDQAESMWILSHSGGLVLIVTMCWDLRLSIGTPIFCSLVFLITVLLGSKVEYWEEETERLRKSHRPWDDYLVEAVPKSHTISKGRETHILMRMASF